jgi:hypothetical protein
MDAHAETVLVMQLADCKLHAPGPTHGVTRCGLVLSDPWLAGPAATVAERARAICRHCFPAWGSA